MGGRGEGGGRREGRMSREDSQKAGEVVSTKHIACYRHSCVPDHVTDVPEACLLLPWRMHHTHNKPPCSGHTAQDLHRQLRPWGGGGSEE